MKRYFISFMFVFIFGLSLFGIKAYAYTPETVTDAQLQSALSAVQDRVSQNPDWIPEGKTKYWTVSFTGGSNGQYFIQLYTDTYKVFAPDQFPNVNSTFPSMNVHPFVNGNWGCIVWINANGTYTLPTTVYSGTPRALEFYETDATVKYTNYAINRGELGTWLRGSVAWGEKWRPTNWDSPASSYDPVAVPTPSNLRIKMILPTGLFPKIKETQVQTTWTPSSGALHLEVSLLYNYKNGSDKITKLLPYITYSDGLYSSLGSFTKLLATDIESFIHSKNTATSGQTFANGKLNLTHYYVRYSLSSGSGLKYGNWVKVDLVNGKSELDKGNVVSQYDEVYQDSDGNEVEVTDNSEYNGIQIDGNGNKVDPASLRSLTDYLMAIPNVLETLFTGFYSLLNGAGKFGQVFGVLFGFLPPEATVIIVTGIGALVSVGIIKVFK